MREAWDPGQEREGEREDSASCRWKERQGGQGRDQQWRHGTLVGTSKGQPSQLQRGGQG